MCAPGVVDVSSKDPTHIHRLEWSNTKPRSAFSKLPTLLAYPRTPGIEWSFDAADLRRSLNYDIKQWFKPYINKECCRVPNSPGIDWHTEEIKTHFVAYLGKLYHHRQDQLQLAEEITHWETVAYDLNLLIQLFGQS